MKSTALAAAAALAALAGCTAPPEGFGAPEQTVLFGHDRESFGEDGVLALTRAAAATAAEGYAAATVIGHTDTVADAEYNLALSQRRADAVRRELIARGVAPGAVVTAAAGQGALAVPTGDGVSEPANRRVVIELSQPGAAPAPDPDRPFAFPLPGAPRT